jgi:hypothetical protein
VDGLGIPASENLHNTRHSPRLWIAGMKITTLRFSPRFAEREIMECRDGNAAPRGY